MKKFLALFCFLSFMLSCDEIIEVEDISNRVVTILAPGNDAVLSTTIVNFSWNTVEDAESYKLQIAKPDFYNAITIVLDTTITNTTFSKELTANTNYQWRVRAENSDYQTAYTTLNFSIGAMNTVDISSEMVTLLAPANNTVFSTTETINFSWESVENASSYVIQIAQPNFANAVEIIEDVTQTWTSFSVSNLQINSYEWRVKAKNSDSETAYSLNSFSVE